MENDKQQKQDEIDLRDIIVGLWEGKLYILGGATLLLVCALFYTHFSAKVYTGTLRVKQIGNMESAIYQPLSETKMLALDAEYLAKSYFERLDNREAIVSAMVDYGLVAQEKNESKVSYMMRVNQAAQQTYNFISPTMKQIENGFPLWKVIIVSGNPEVALMVLKKAMEVEQKDLQAKLKRDFERALQMHKSNIANRLKDIEIQKQALIKAYEMQRDIRIAALQEQSGIARRLDLSQGIYVQLVQNQGSFLSMLDLRATPPHYTEGYLALEKELDLLKARSNPELYMPELTALVKRKMSLESDWKAEQAMALFQVTPLAGTEFKAADYNLAGMRMEPNSRRVMTLPVSFVLGGVLGLFVLIIRNVLRNK